MPFMILTIACCRAPAFVLSANRVRVSQMSATAQHTTVVFAYLQLGEDALESIDALPANVKSLRIKDVLIVDAMNERLKRNSTFFRGNF